MTSESAASQSNHHGGVVSMASQIRAAEATHPHTRGRPFSLARLPQPLIHGRDLPMGRHLVHTRIGRFAHPRSLAHQQLCDTAGDLKPGHAWCPAALKVTRRAASPARLSWGWSYVDHSALPRVVEPWTRVYIGASPGRDFQPHSGSSWPPPRVARAGRRPASLEPAAAPRRSSRPPPRVR